VKTKQLPEVNKMEIKRKICPSGLGSNPNRPLISVDYITIHCTGNYSTGADAKSHADYQFTGGSGKASWHYTVDKDSIWQSYEDTSAVWHAGDGNGPGNTTSLAVEICVCDKPGFSAACENAAWLTAELLKKHGLPLARAVQHHNWSGKDCPYELRTKCWGIGWDDFICMVSKQMADAAHLPDAAEPPAEPDKYYRVQLGAFTNPANAEGMLRRVREAGFEGAFVKYM
jgi:N-acetylmuramoyl-L-alanine amidase CwlA